MRIQADIMSFHYGHCVIARSLHLVGSGCVEAEVAGMSLSVRRVAGVTLQVDWALSPGFYFLYGTHALISCSHKVERYQNTHTNLCSFVRRKFIVAFSVFPVNFFVINRTSCPH